MYHVYHVSGARADAVVFFSRRCAGGSPPTRSSKYPRSDLLEVDKVAYTQWLEGWLRGAAPGLRPPAPSVTGGYVSPAAATFAWYDPLLRRSTRACTAFPVALAKLKDRTSKALILYYRSVCLLDPVMRHVLPLYHVSGTRADENRVISSRRCAGGSLDYETETFTYPLSDLEETDEAAHDQWFETWKSELREARAALGDPPNSSVQQTRDTAGVDDIADQNDSAKAAFDKFLTYENMKQQTGMGNDEDRRTALRVRDFCSPFSLRATCPRHPFRDHASRLVHCTFRRLCTRASLMKYSR